MGSVSATFLSWRPLPPLLRQSSDCRIAASAKRSQVASLTHTPGRLSDLSSSYSSSRDFRLNVNWHSQTEKTGRNGCGVLTRARMGLDPGGGRSNNEGGGIGRVVVNVVLAGGLTYLTLTGKLGWVFDTLLSLWVLVVLIPIVAISSFLWFAEREIVRGACPNCGQEFQMFEFALKEKPNLCPYCSQPFKLDENRQFVRDEPRFSNTKSGGFKDIFGGFDRNTPRRKEQDAGGTIVDVEAEVMDRD